MAKRFVNSFFKKAVKRRWSKTAQWIVTAQGPRCSLCRGELYPGDPYFELDGRTVCEDCLGRYARIYFAHRLRQVGREGRVSPSHEPSPGGKGAL